MKLKITVGRASLMTTLFMILLLIGLQGCDINDPFKGTPFGRKPAQETFCLSCQKPIRKRFDRCASYQLLPLEIQPQCRSATLKTGVASPSVALVTEQGSDVTEWL